MPLVRSECQPKGQSRREEVRLDIRAACSGWICSLASCGPQSKASPHVGRSTTGRPDGCASCSVKKEPESLSLCLHRGCGDKEGRLDPGQKEKHGWAVDTG